VEYIREVMDSVCNKRTEEVTFMKSAQVAGTEAILNVIGYYVHQDPAPILDVEPDNEAAEDFSRRRLAPMIRDTPVLRERIADPKGGKTSRNTIKEKEYPGGIITIVGSGSPSRLASKPIRILVANDVDRFKASAGLTNKRQEGDPLSLAIKRTQTFWNKKIFVNSTPTSKGISIIEERFYLGSQGHRYVPCPLCGRMQILIFNPRSQFSDLAKGMLSYVFEDSKVKDVWYQCEACSGKIPQLAKYKMDKMGEWRHLFPDRIKHRSFQIWEAYSPWGDWYNICETFEESKHRVEKLRVFVNTVTGETFDEDATSTITGNALYDRREDYYPKVPEGVLFLTAFTDVQEDRLECYVEGWSDEEENFLIDYFVAEGSPQKKETWQMLDDYLFKTEFEHENGYRAKFGQPGGIIIVGVDSGDNTPLVYSYVKKHHKEKRIFATKGNRGWGHDACEESKNRKLAVRLLLIGVNDVKRLIRDRLMNKEFGEGFQHFNKKVEMDYFDQLLSERLRLKEVNGRKEYVWELLSMRRNEALDCKVGNYAMYKKIVRSLNLKQYKERLQQRMDMWLSMKSDSKNDVEINDAIMSKTKKKRFSIQVKV
jgi:phage terminase large subunit GpA-like protein